VAAFNCHLTTPVRLGRPTRVALRRERSHLPTELASGRATPTLCHKAQGMLAAASLAENAVSA
jgi:hypothetical protein